MNDSDEIYALLERIPDRRGLAELIVTLKREKREYQDSLLQAQNVVEELRNSVRMFNRLLADRDEQLREMRESLYTCRGEVVDAQYEIVRLRDWEQGLRLTLRKALEDLWWKLDNVGDLEDFINKWMPSVKQP